MAKQGRGPIGAGVFLALEAVATLSVAVAIALASAAGAILVAEAVGAAHGALWDVVLCRDLATVASVEIA